MLQETSNYDNFEKEIINQTGRTIGQFVSEAIDKWFTSPDAVKTLEFTTEYCLNQYTLVFDYRTNLYKLIIKT